MKDNLLEFGHFLLFMQVILQFRHALATSYAKGMILHRIYFFCIFLWFKKEIFADVSYAASYMDVR